MVVKKSTIKPKSTAKQSAPAPSTTKPDYKMAAAADLTQAEPSAENATAESVGSATTTAAPTTDNPATTLESVKASEKLAPKLRRKADIINALRAGAHVLHTPQGLYRIVQGHDVHPASKRRISAMIDAGQLKHDQGHDNRYLFYQAAGATTTNAPANAGLPDPSHARVATPSDSEHGIRDP